MLTFTHIFVKKDNHFTICCGVYKTTVMHKSYSQAVHKTVDKKRKREKLVRFPQFLKENPPNSVDNPVHTVYKSSG